MSNWTNFKISNDEMWIIKKKMKKEIDKKVNR